MKDREYNRTSPFISNSLHYSSDFYPYLGEFRYLCIQYNQYSMVLSVIIPVYKVEDYLQGCLECVLDEAGIDMEVILVDDCSPDSSGKIADRFAASDSRVKVIHREENGGLSMARNTGIDAASGDYITFVDSDDSLLKGTLVENFRMIENNPGIDILEYPVYVYFGGNRSELYYPKDPYSYNGNTAFDRWVARKGYYHCYAWNKIYRRSLWNGVRFPEGRYYEDIMTVPKVIGRAKSVKCSNVGMYYYYDREGSISNSLNVEVLSDFIYANLELWKRLEDSRAFMFVDSDVFYVNLCNWQAELLLCGGGMIIPEYRLMFLKRVLQASDISFSTKLKAVACKLFGRSYCRVLSSYLKLRRKCS